jgi:hypothetical protein
MDHTLLRTHLVYPVGEQVKSEQFVRVSGSSYDVFKRRKKNVTNYMTVPRMRNHHTIFFSQEMCADGMQLVLTERARWL